MSVYVDVETPTCEICFHQGEALDVAVPDIQIELTETNDQKPIDEQIHVVALRLVQHCDLPLDSLVGEGREFEILQIEFDLQITQDGVACCIFLRFDYISKASVGGGENLRAVGQRHAPQQLRVINDPPNGLHERVVQVCARAVRHSVRESLRVGWKIRAFVVEQPIVVARPVWC